MHCNGYPFSGVMCILQLGLNTSILFFIEGKVVGWCVCVCVSGTTFNLTTSELASPSPAAAGCGGWVEVEWHLSDALPPRPDKGTS